MMTTSNTQPVAFSFESNAVEAETFVVTGFSGEEVISRPFCFKIDLLADDPDVDMDSLLYSPACLTIAKGDHERKIHGVVRECRLSQALPDQRYCYHVELVPRIWLLSLNRQNQIYQNLSVPDIVAHEIQAATAKGSTKEAAAGLVSDDFEMRLMRNYPEREYTVQYQESDLDFISRLMEHEGLFYFFEQHEDREKAIVSDTNVHFPALTDEDTLAYCPDTGLSRSAEEAVLDFSCTSRRIPRKTILKDYNYRMPHIVMQGEADIDTKAHGVICEYGDHFRSREEGSELAQIRAQEWYCAKRTFEGQSDSVRLSPGYRFKLDDYFREEFNSEYIVTGAVHKGRQPVEGITGSREDPSDQAFYENSFACIPSTVDFRPPRRTRKPVITGLMSAHVDAAQMEERAEIDSHGRYKLVMPFDLSEAEAGKASRFVRKAQPYGGEEMGMHFPLLKGTEVICDFIDGNPDRPIIVGVVPNPGKKSVVTAENYTRNVIRTPSGVLFEINDGKPKQ